MVIFTLMELRYMRFNLNRILGSIKKRLHNEQAELKSQINMYTWRRNFEVRTYITWFKEGDCNTKFYHMLKEEGKSFM